MFQNKTEVKQDYEKLEKELIQKRQRTLEKLTEFMENIVLPKWTEFSKHRHKIEYRLKHIQQVGVCQARNL